MYQSERELLNATNLTGHDRVAQRALRLRLNFRALVPFAIHDRSALAGIAEGALNANAMLVICHQERGYEFVHLQLFNQSIGKSKPDAIDELPTPIGSLPLPLSEYERIIGEFERWPEQIRAAHNLPRVLISGNAGVKILHGQAALDACTEMRQNAANAA
jgi:hypothetical protein